MNVNKAIKELQTMTPAINAKYRPYVDQVINLFKDRKIEKRKEAEKLLDQFASRGKAPQSAIKKLTEKYSKAESAIFFISGTIYYIDTYKQQIKKTGTIKERHYDIEMPYALQIKAKNKAEA
jgi:hypothetical protein